MTGSFHDLLRAYAVELGQAIDSADDRRAAQHRLLDHYLHTIHQAAALMHPRQDPLVLAPPQPGVTPEDLDDHESAMAWFTAERPVLLAAVEQAHEAGFATHTWQLSWALTEPLCRSGRWQELASCQRTALEAAQRLGDPARQAYAHHRLGGACTHLGRYADAHAHLEQALHRFAELRDDTGAAHTHQDLVVLLTTQGRHEEALRHAEQALWLYQSADHRAGQAGALNNIGWGHTLLGNPGQGVSSCTRALALQREIGDRRSEADTLDSLGYAYHHLGDYAHARTHYEQALTLYRELGVWHSQADTLTRLGETHEAAGDTDAAERAWLQALSILDQHDHSETERIHTKLRHLAPTL